MPRAAGPASTLLDDKADVDVVLVDIMMPDMDGYETIREIRVAPGPRRPADRRGHRQGDEGRPAEVHPGRGLGLCVEAGGHRPPDLGAAGLDPARGRQKLASDTVVP